jgi:hypothetical protein
MTEKTLTHAQAIAIGAAGRRYRDAMWHYLAERTATPGDRAADAERVTRIGAAFGEAMRAEAALFALLDTLAGYAERLAERQERDEPGELRVT